ncbi:MAG: hypothetical protein RIG77_20260 [Cyclobacteriaceae bacterium]
MTFLKLWLYLVVFIALPAQLIAQQLPYVKRMSNISFEIPKKGKESFSLALKSSDRVTIDVRTARQLNFRIFNPSNQLIHESLVRNESQHWMRKDTLQGVYKIELESVAFLFGTEVAMDISVTRPDFVYGSQNPTDVVKNKRKLDTLSNGNFKITKTNPKSYPYTLKKGDTLLLELMPLSRKTPDLEVSNEFGEIVFASVPAKPPLKASIPVLDSGLYEIKIASNAFLGKDNNLMIQKISPTRFTEKKNPPPPVLIEEPPYDTLPEIYMDTVIFLGAVRDVIHANYHKLDFHFQNDSSILYWGILFGSGSSFQQKMDHFEPLLQGEAMSVGATDILSAYGMGYLKKLPTMKGGEVEFRCSSDLTSCLHPTVRPNYGLVHVIDTPHYVSFENKSQSTSQNVYVKIVVFKKNTS